SLYDCVSSPSPLDAGANAELVVFGIRHPNPERFAEALHTSVESVCAERDQPLDLGFDVVDDDVEMHPVLAGFRLGHALENELRSVVEGQRPTFGELVERRCAFDFGALDPHRGFETAGLDAYGTGEEAAAFLYVLGVEILDGWRSGHRETVDKAVGRDMDAV